MSASEKRQDKVKKPHEMTHSEKIATVADCSTTQVLRVLKNQRGRETALSERILVADTLIQEKENLLLQEVKRVMKF